MEVTNKIDLLDKSVVSRLITEMNKSEDLDRRTYSFDNWQGYSGNLKPYIERELRRTRPKSWQGYTIPSVSMSKMIVDKVSKAYKEAPLRKVTEDESGAKIERLESIYEEGGAQNQLPFLDTSVNLHKYSLVWVTYRDEAQRYQFLTLQPHEFAVVRNKDTGDLECVILNYGNRDITSGAESGDGLDDIIAESQQDSSAQTKIYAMWTAENFVIVKEEKSSVMTAAGEVIKKSITYVENPGNPNNENFIGMIPFVWVSKELSFDMPTQSPILDQTVTANALMAEYLTAANIQGTGQMVFKYPEKFENLFKKISAGLLTAIKLPQSSDPDDSETDVDYISPSPNLEGQRQAVMTYMKAVMKEHGISSGESVGGDAESFSSGLERAIANSAVDDIVKANQERYMQMEGDVFEIIKAWELWLGNRFFAPEDKLSVLFRKPKVMISDRETLENIEKRMNLGLISKNMALRMLDPNLTEEEADEMLDGFTQEKLNQAKVVIGGNKFGQDNKEVESGPIESTERRPEES